MPDSLPYTFCKADDPPTPLGRLRILSPSCSLRVSPLVLGNMSLGSNWATRSPALGECTKEQAFEVYDTFYEAGGNYIDTANNYQDGQSEIWLGEWLQMRGVRDQMVLATKYTTMYTGDVKFKAQHCGNGFKSMHLSVKDSLKKLQTDYVDILFLHWWDYSASIEEVMQSLNILVKERKVLYLGISDTPAWLVAAANSYARQHGLAQFVVYQGKQNLLTREAERDHIPMMRHFGMASTPWGALGQGRLQTPEHIQERRKQKQTVRGGDADLTETEIAASKTLADIGKELGGKSLHAVALAYVIAKYEYCYPIIGVRHAHHLKSNLDALSIQFTKEQLDRLDQAGGDFSLGTPMQQFGVDARTNGGKHSFLLDYSGTIDYPQTARSFAAPRQ